MDDTTRGLGGGSSSLDEVRRALEPEPSLVERVVIDEHVWQGKIFAVDHLEVELSDGSHAWREVVHHHGGAGVVAIHDDRVCLVRQYRVVLGRVTLEIPAGKLEGGRARREVRRTRACRGDGTARREARASCHGAWLPGLYRRAYRGVSRPGTLARSCPSRRGRSPSRGLASGG